MNPGSRYLPNRPFVCLDAEGDDEGYAITPELFKSRHYVFGESGHLLSEMSSHTINLNVPVDLPQRTA